MESQEMVSGQIDHSPEATMFRAGAVNMLSNVEVVSGQNVRLPLFAFRIDLRAKVPNLGIFTLNKHSTASGQFVHLRLKQHENEEWATQ